MADIRVNLTKEERDVLLKIVRYELRESRVAQSDMRTQSLPTQQEVALKLLNKLQTWGTPV